MNFINLVKLNNNKNILTLSKFFFKSDLFLKKKKVLFICNKITEYILKNRCFLNLIKKIKYLINEKFYFKYKTYYSKYNKFFFYNHNKKSTAFIKYKSYSNYLQILLFNIIFNKPRDYKTFANSKLIDSNDYVIDLLKKTKIKKYYFF
ncbi:hypothetical protein [Candidatus Vidania fulgoroideorum]